MSASPAEPHSAQTESCQPSSCATAGAATAAVVACVACCTLPFALPAVAMTIAGGLLAWFASAHLWIGGLAMMTVVSGWALV